MKRTIAVFLTTMIVFGFSTTPVGAIGFSLTNSILVAPSNLLDKGSVEEAAPTNSDLKEALRYEAEDPTATLSGIIALPSVLVPVDTQLEPKEAEEVTFTKVIPISPEDTLGVSTFFSRFHRGIDIRAKYGTPIHAANSGRVIESAYEAWGYGRYIVVEHEEKGSRVLTLYAHMKEVVVKKEDRIHAGDVIGHVGMTGRSTGPHLHFEVYQDDMAIDPIRYFTKGLPGKVLAKK